MLSEESPHQQDAVGAGIAGGMDGDNPYLTMKRGELLKRVIADLESASAGLLAPVASGRRSSVGQARPSALPDAATGTGRASTSSDAPADTEAADLQKRLWRCVLTTMGSKTEEGEERHLLQQPQLLERNKRVKRLLRGRIVQRYELAFAIHSLVNATSGDDFVLETDEALARETERQAVTDAEDEGKTSVKLELESLMAEMKREIGAMHADAGQLIQLTDQLGNELETFASRDRNSVCPTDEDEEGNEEMSTLKAQRDALQLSVDSLVAANRLLQVDEADRETALLEEERNRLRMAQLQLAADRAAIQAATLSLSKVLPADLDVGRLLGAENEEEGGGREEDHTAAAVRDDAAAAIEASVRQQIQLHNCFSSVVGTDIRYEDGKRDENGAEIEPRTILTFIIQPSRVVRDLVDFSATRSHHFDNPKDKDSDMGDPTSAAPPPSATERKICEKITIEVFVSKPRHGSSAHPEILGIDASPPFNEHAMFKSLHSCLAVTAR
eukprot:Selendium_serpulae@DN4900_c0_g2_i1.p1